MLLAHPTALNKLEKKFDGRQKLSPFITEREKSITFDDFDNVSVIIKKR